MDVAPEDRTGEISLFSPESPRVMELNLVTLPQFNVSIITRMLSVPERLKIMVAIHPRFRDFVYRPQCFPDLSFTVDETGQAYAPKILSANINNGITYVEINIKSKHPFVRNVALLAGMWNLQAETWSKTDWPSVINVDSLQLTLGGMTGLTCLQLDRHWTEALNLRANSKPQQKQSSNRDRHDDDAKEDERERGEERAVKKRPALAVDDPNESVLRNLFFIKFEHSDVTPRIEFPRTLLGLGLQSFNSSLFGMDWWRRQVLHEQRLFTLRFLVLSCCEFEDDEMAVLLAACRNVEHLSLRYTSWEGCVSMPPSLRSLGFFPQKEFRGRFVLSRCHQLWQISTRLNENDEASVQFLNKCSKLPSIKRVKFEFIRRPQFTETPLNLAGLLRWDRRKDEDFELALWDDDLEEYPLLRKIFAVHSKRSIVNTDKVHFQDCPFWSERSKEFITMAKHRKLLVR